MVAQGSRPVCNVTANSIQICEFVHLLLNDQGRQREELSRACLFDDSLYTDSTHMQGFKFNTANTAQMKPISFSSWFQDSHPDFFFFSH